MRPIATRPAITAFALLLAAACADYAPTAPRADPALAALAEMSTGSAIWRNQLEGTTPDGAKFALFRPHDWNGDIVYYAHGIIDPALPIALPTNDDAPAIRDGLGERGYAVAYSSFSENGYAFRDGVEHTRQLRELVREQFGPPRRSYLVGHSLGAQVVQAMAEARGRKYDGALALCGVLGGTRLQVQYIGHVRTLFDYFFPTWFPGTHTMSTPVVGQDEVIRRAMTAIQSPGGFQRFGMLSMIDQGLLAGRNPNEQITTLLNVLVYHVRGVNDFLARTNGDVLFDNAGTEYSSAVLPAAVLAAVNDATTGVRRFTATPGANAWLDENYEPTGKLRIPMLAVHKTHDRLVPYRHEAAYRTIVDAVGRGELLRQKPVDAYGHCEFGAPTTLAAFEELVAWVDSRRSDDEEDEEREAGEEIAAATR
jgi:pimeloyl-ACP methyl ester carboxylesterase